jgi:hypothetical protein
MTQKPLLKKNRIAIAIVLIESCFCCFASWIQHSMCLFDLQEYHPTFLLITMIMTLMKKLIYFHKY